MNRWLLAVGVAGSLLPWSAAARAQGEPSAAASEPTHDDKASPFGSARTLVLSSDNQVALSYIATSTPAGTSGAASGSSVTVVELAPSVDYFVARGFSIGGRIAWAWENSSGSNVAGSVTMNSFGVGPRIGAYVPLGKHVGLWPKVGVSYAVSSFSESPPPTAPGGVNGIAFYEPYTTTSFLLYATVPVIFDVAPHFFVGFGPQVSTQLSNSTTSGAGQTVELPKTTAIGAQLTLGGDL